MKLIKYFDYLLDDKVNVNPTRMSLLDTRTTAIVSYLKRDEVFGPILKTDIPQGSYAQKTIIRPRPDFTYDADLLLHLDPVPDWEYNEYVGKLYTALGRSPVYMDMRSRRTRCVVVDYADEFHVDLVPYIELDGAGYVTNRHTGERERTDPKGFTGWLKDRNRDANGHLVKTIRLLKYARDITWGFNVKSVLLTTLVGERISATAEVLDSGCYADVPSTLRKVVVDLDDWAQARPSLPPITDPGGTDDRFDQRWDQEGWSAFRDKLHALGQKVDEAFYEPDKDKSVKAWQTVFGDGFVVPPATAGAGVRRGLVVVRGKQVVPTERYLDRDLGIPFQLNGHRVVVDARVVRKDGFRAYGLADNGNRVERSRTVSFEVTSCTVPGIYDVYWKVRNEGPDAAGRDALRGEILRRGKRITEQTAYVGPHWVECYIVKDGRCLARTRQPVNIF